MSNHQDQDGPQSSRPPAPPPLPPPSRYGQRAATAIARFAHPFFTGPRGVPQRDADVPKISRANSDDGQLTLSSMSKSEAIHKTALPISAVDISPYRTHAVLAGREILKTIRVEGSLCKEDFNLRSKIIDYAAVHDSNKDATSAGHKDQLAAVDVKWSHGNFDTTIATAAANGRIIVYDLMKDSVEVARLHEHSRQVHSIAFNPHQPAFLLSGSQDGTIRLWDLRAPDTGGRGGRSVKTCSSWKRYAANSEGIRAVKWSPQDGYVFAIGTENGSVQKWDLRKENAPILRLHGHDKSCSAIDWHPNGRYLASGSTEKLIKIWDFSSEDRRMKPINQIRTPQAVVHMQWRPDISTTGEDIPESSTITTHISTSYDTKDPRIHIWDVQRPNVPVLEIEKYNTPASCLVWHSRDLLWSVGQTGTFTQNDMKMASKPASRHGSTLAIGPDGRLAFFSSSRSRYGMIMHSLDSSPPDQRSPYPESMPDTTYNPRDLSPEGHTIESNLQRRRQRTAELRSLTNFSSNPADDKLERLENFRTQLLASYTSTQLAAVGRIPEVCDSESFAHLAENYIMPSYDFLAGLEPDPLGYARTAFEGNAQIAEVAGETEVAQTWRILGYVVNAELRKRAEENKKRPLKSSNNDTTTYVKKHSRSLEMKSNETGGIGAGLKAEASALTTPVVRPSQDPSILHASLAQSLSLSAGEGSSDSSSLPSQKQETMQSISPFSNSIHSKSPDKARSELITGALRTTTSNGARQVSDLMIPFSSFPGLEEHLEESRNALNSYRAKPRTVLNLDGPYGTMQDMSNMASFDRRDSNESFQMFSASVDSDQRSFPMQDSFDERTSFSQVSNGSFASSFPPNYPRTRLDDLREDDGPTTPLILEPEELIVHDDLPVLEKINTQTTNDLTELEPIRRPDSSEKARIHKQDFTTSRQEDQHPSDTQWLQYTSNSEPPTDPKPWSVYSILRPLVEYHTDILLDAQLPTMLATWLWQFFPSEFNRAQITTLVLFYHKRLLSLQLHEPAARLRQCSALLFPEILDYTAGSEPAILFCRNCNSSLETNPTSPDQTFCTRCKTLPAACSICESFNPNSLPATGTTTGQDSAPNLWTWCQGCGHGGHAACLTEWFSQATISEGSCPILGCGHDCVSGIRREQVIAELERQRKKHRKSVVRDEWSVAESRAVEKARDIVATDSVGRRGAGNAGNSGLGLGAGGGRGVGVANGRVGPGPGAGRKVRIRTAEGGAETGPAVHE